MKLTAFTMIFPSNSGFPPIEATEGMITEEGPLEYGEKYCKSDNRSYESRVIHVRRQREALKIEVNELTKSNEVLTKSNEVLTVQVVTLSVQVQQLTNTNETTNLTLNEILKRLTTVMPILCTI